MLQVSGLYKSFGEQVLFSDASCALNPRERIGLVGRNGSGKSTFFKLILDEEHPDAGTITHPKGYRIGKLSQHLVFKEQTILDEVCLGLPADERDQTYRGEIILSGLGFSQEDMVRPAREFSGGFQIRINLARLLLSEPDLLLLDEPTNYLDIVSARWLSQTLREWKGEMILITHDRAFMDSVTTHTMLIYRGGLRKVAGPTEKLYEAIALDEEVYEKTRLNDEKKRREIEQFVNRFRAKASKATLVQSRVKALEKMSIKEELTEEDTLDFLFASKQFHGKTLLDAKGITFGYSPQQLLIEDFSVSIGPTDRIGVIGKNGRGKSTLLRILAEELSPLHGSISKSAGTSRAYFGQTNIERLSSRCTVEEEIANAHPGMHRTRVRNICGVMMFEGDKALKKISVLSGGERSRVLLGKIIVTPSNLLLLDEPTNHLDLESVEALKDALSAYDGAVVMVTHDEMLLQELCTRLIVFQGDQPYLFEGDYEYFLQKIGWEEEGLSQSLGMQREKKSRKEQKTPLPQRSHTKKLEKLEGKIIALEEKERAARALLESATAQGDATSIQHLSLELHNIQCEINALFEEMSLLSNGSS